MAVGSPPRTSSGYMSENLGWNRVLNDVLETVPELLYPESVATYGKMRNDPQLTAVLNAYTLPLRQAPKYVDPAGCKSEVVNLIADDLGLPVLGKDNKPGPARRRGVDFEEHFRIALLNLIFGHMPFAQRYEILDGKARLAELAERMPTTITEIQTTDEGYLAGMLQFGEKTPVPAKDLVWYVHEREGSAWQGRSMLRSAYGPWLLKHEMWRVLATSNRRFGMGVPTVNAPAGATGEQIEQAKLLAAAVRVGDQSGVGLPDGFTLQLQGITGSTPNTLDFIRYLDGQMAQMALASVLNLDASPNGSRALGDTFVNLLLTSLNAIANEMASVLTKLAVQMVDYNWGEQENAPRIVIGDVGSRPEITAEAIVALMGAGAVTPDDELEAWVRERWTLPEKPDEPEPEPVPAPEPPSVDPVTGLPVPQGQPEGMPPMTGGQAQASRFGRRSRALRATATNRRELTDMEAAASVDPEKLDNQWSTQLDYLLRNWSTISRDQRQELTDQIQAAVNDDKIDALAALAVDSDDAALLLAEAMEAMANDAAYEMKQEAKRQGVDVSGEEIDTDRLTEIAAAVATIIASSTANAAGREALRIWAPGDTGADVADGVDDHMRSLSDSYLRDQLGNALSAAQNHGRQAVLSAAPPAKYFASEILDSNTCKNCRAIDGQQFRDMDEAEQAYVSGGYRLCLGRLRCRGIVVAVWDD
jgi:hypothetical protein